MMKKVLLVIFIAIHPLCYEAIEFQEVRVSKFKYNLRVRDFGDFTILDSRPLQIVFEDIDAITVQCWYKHKKLISQRHGENFFSNGTTIITINEVTSDMSCKWRCNLSDVNNNNVVYSFKIRIKTAIPAFIDTTLLQYTLANVSEYDGFNEYFCEERETINLYCQKPFKASSLTLRYYNANGTKIIETDNVDKDKNAEDKLTFRVLMRPETNRSYVECTLLTAAADQDKQRFTYRIIFIIRKEPVKNDYFTITINDMKLISKPVKVNNRDIYYYNFIYGEILTITCEKKEKDTLAQIDMGIQLSPTMTQDGKFINPKGIEKTQSSYTLIVETTYLDRAQIEFSLQNSDSKPFLGAMINFYVESYDGPAIVGLPANDMLYQYSKNYDEWVAHYQYTPNETLLLTCITITNKALRWLRENKLVGMTKGENNKVGIKYISDNFTLNQNDITCQMVDTRKKSWTLVFHRKLDLSPMDPHKNISDNALDGPQKLFVIIGSTVGVLLAILITALLVFCWYRRYRITNQKDKPSTKFSENDNPLSDVLNQGNNGEYTYITNEYNYIKSDYSSITFNSLYSKYMSDTTYNGHTENHYTEIDDYSRKNTDNLDSANNVTCDNNKYDYASSSRDHSYNNL
ncbi:unnamed protein product [Arctia plantaginis]|uniref:Allorecognition 2 n=1 Tax=Arctia plantaginis TaxID=874455 RepID=A0A8S1BQ67_ARCPL|nr:unnamed protein product [Arctia plantaginis]